MHEDLRKLHDLQRLITALRSARERIDDTPRRVEAVEAARARSEADLAATRHALEEAQKTRRKLEATVVDLEQKLSKYQDQIFLVKKNEEYRALMQEIASTKEEVRNTEDRILEQMEIIEEKQEKVRDQDRAHQHARVDCDQQIRDLLQEKERLEAETKRLEEEKLGIEAHLDRDLLATFEKVARGREGIAVAAILDESCELCHVRIRPQAFQELKLGTSLIRCDSCNRFLYLKEAAGAPAGSGESHGGG